MDNKTNRRSSILKTRRQVDVLVEEEQTIGASNATMNRRVSFQNMKHVQQYDKEGGKFLHTSPLKEKITDTMDSDGILTPRGRTVAEHPDVPNCSSNVFDGLHHGNLTKNTTVDMSLDETITDAKTICHQKTKIHIEQTVTKTYKEQENLDDTMALFNTTRRIGNDDMEMEKTFAVPAMKMANKTVNESVCMDITEDNGGGEMKAEYNNTMDIFNTTRTTPQDMDITVGSDGRKSRGSIDMDITSVSGGRRSIDMDITDMTQQRAATPVNNQTMDMELTMMGNEEKMIRPSLSPSNETMLLFKSPAKKISRIEKRMDETMDMSIARPESAQQVFEETKNDMDITMDKTIEVPKYVEPFSGNNTMEAVKTDDEMDVEEEVEQGMKTAIEEEVEKDVKTAIEKEDNSDMVISMHEETAIIEKSTVVEKVVEEEEQKTPEPEEIKTLLIEEDRTIRTEFVDSDVPETTQKSMMMDMSDVSTNQTSAPHSPISHHSPIENTMAIFGNETSKYQKTMLIEEQSEYMMAATVEETRQEDSMVIEKDGIEDTMDIFNASKCGVVDLERSLYEANELFKKIDEQGLDREESSNSKSESMIMRNVEAILQQSLLEDSLREEEKMKEKEERRASLRRSAITNASFGIESPRRAMLETSMRRVETTSIDAYRGRKSEYRHETMMVEEGEEMDVAEDVKENTTIPAPEAAQLSTLSPIREPTLDAQEMERMRVIEEEEKRQKMIEEEEEKMRMLEEAKKEQEMAARKLKAQMEADEKKRRELELQSFQVALEKLVHNQKSLKAMQEHLNMMKVRYEEMVELVDQVKEEKRRENEALIKAIQDVLKGIE